MRSIKWSTTHEPILKQFCEMSRKDEKGKHVHGPIFNTHWEFLCFTATLGWHFGRKSEVSGDTKEIPSRIYENKDRAIDLMFLLALSEKRDTDILREEEENKVVGIFEQYAHGGLEIVDQWLKETPSDLHGNQAIIAALHKNGFLERSTSKPVGEDEVEF
jgi:dnd system-associated protein 4